FYNNKQRSIIYHCIKIESSELTGLGVMQTNI
ncbi:MAG: hypothetical protein ACI8RD_010078, partial [Bacillariaceae sp.]